MPNKRLLEWSLIVLCLTLALVLAVFNFAADGDESDLGTAGAGRSYYHGMLGPDNPKIRVEGSKTFIWAGGDPEAGQDEWFDFTGAPLPAEELQFGIGKDRIRAIDDPLFVSPDDPRLLQFSGSLYRPEEGPATADDIMVIGYADGRDARAYPIALLDHHELVNDRLNGKPVAVGW